MQLLTAATLLPAIVTLLTVLLLIGTAMYVGYARGKYRVAAPATSGHPAFERAFRVQMNTLEGTVAFLPALWVAAHYASPLWAGVLGLVWLAARVWYAIAYARDAAKRGPAFGAAMLALAALLVLAFIGLGRAVLAGG
jgi:uncharacterized membrane protein YecN with MAPEG domain